MSVFIYVEGPSDEAGLKALFGTWQRKLRETKSSGLKVVNLVNKSQFLENIGERAARRLVEDEDNLVVALPDLHPASDFDGTEYRHTDVESLAQLQRRRVKKALLDTQGIANPEECLERFFGGAFKHDFEMLLLAAEDELRSVIGTRGRLGNWRHPVEDQNFENPPKKIVERLFREKGGRKRRYRGTVDAGKVLRGVSGNVRSILVRKRQPQCPEFHKVLDWLGDKTGVPVD